jgi:hypothetical protein
VEITEAKELGALIVRRFVEPFNLNGSPFRTTTSIGITTIGNFAPEYPEDPLREADAECTFRNSQTATRRRFINLRTTKRCFNAFTWSRRSSRHSLKENCPLTTNLKSIYRGVA